MSYNFLIVGPISVIPVGKQISSSPFTILPTGEITAAVPHSPHSAKSFTSDNSTSLCSTSNPRYLLATSTIERLVIDGSILSDFGVTILPSLVTNKKFAPPVSSTLVLVCGSKYKFSS